MFHLRGYCRLACSQVFFGWTTRTRTLTPIRSLGELHRFRSTAHSLALLSETLKHISNSFSVCYVRYSKTADAATSLTRTFRTTLAMQGLKRLLGVPFPTVLPCCRYSSSFCQPRSNSMSHWRLGSYSGLFSSYTKHSVYSCCVPYSTHPPLCKPHTNTQSKTFISSNTNRTDRDQRYRLTKDLKEDIQTIPNLLTCCRMGAAPILSYLVLHSHFSWALGLFVCAGITDLLDGYIARNFANQKSMLGTALDPLADKILVSFLTISLAAVDLLPIPLLLVIVGRDIGLIGVSFYIRYISLPPPKTLKRYFDVTYATAQLNPTLLSKVNTGIQLTLLAACLAAPVMGFVDHIYLQALWYLTATTTILSGFGYILARKDVVKFLDEDLSSMNSKK
ncbi:uncharacterized protein LOC106867467 isoform X1 [Octopus bimaculoides]|uniref:cardiolipin synthase (CMP-forming) n=1 Tax=Octopus bimaculoides TaxID=37653 RepID=A0A0L8I0L3_OCTBM|nr:uncharacterized protein LOC106867467 isoform X1 [Octopus bimaculoides]|eukprot:XP_014767834.1 PREDICTED: uncharacterized protein LOC106867467 isoform X1 [Octopus bimaculoides]